MQKTFVDVGGLTVHVRTAGEGPAVLLLHQAPISGRTMESRIERLSGEFFCIAPDLTGLGQSDSLDGGLVTVERMAGVMLGLLDHLGIDNVTIYGQHTGALVATEIALRDPARVSAVVIGGYPIYTAEESSQRVTSYAPEVPRPTWDGAHLAWMWYRYREQFIYWPWNTKEPRTRATCAVPSKEFLHAGVAEIAITRESYITVYHAAFDYDAEGALRRVKVPVHFILDLADSLSLKIELAATANPALHRWPGATEEIEEIEQRVIRQATSSQQTISSATIAARGSARRQVVEWETGAIELTVLRGRDDVPVCVVLPPFPVGARAVAPELPQGSDRTFVLVDPLRLPDDIARAEWLDGFAGAVGDAVAALTQQPFDIVSAGSAATLAAVLSDRLADRIGTVVLVDPDDRTDGTLFDATICASGGHLLRLWDRLRFERMRTPKSTPRDGATVRARYENLNQLGRYAWDAISRIELIPAWDRLVAGEGHRERTLLASDKTRVVFTGIDGRGRFESQYDGHGRATSVAGTTDAPFREAITILSRK